MASWLQGQQVVCKTDFSLKNMHKHMYFKFTFSYIMFSLVYRIITLLDNVLDKKKSVCILMSVTCSAGHLSSGDLVLVLE